MSKKVDFRNGWKDKGVDVVTMDSPPSRQGDTIQEPVTWEVDLSKLQKITSGENFVTYKGEQPSFVAVHGESGNVHRLEPGKKWEVFLGEKEGPLQTYYAKVYEPVEFQHFTPATGTLSTNHAPITLMPRVDKKGKPTFGLYRISGQVEPDFEGELRSVVD